MDCIIDEAMTSHVDWAPTTQRKRGGPLGPSTKPCHPNQTIHANSQAPVRRDGLSQSIVLPWIGKLLSLLATAVARINLSGFLNVYDF